MKKRKSFFSRKKRSSGRYGLEAAILCALLMAAAYVGGVDISGDAPKPTSKRELSVQKREAPVKQTFSDRAKDKSSRAAAAGKSSPVADEREYRLVRASDGDSFILEDGARRSIRVRLYGVDAPESKQRFGQQSREHLIALIKTRPLRLKTMYLDNYNRAVSLVFLTNGDGSVDELSVNQRQVQTGMAWVYDYFCTSDICKTWKIEEAMARKQKLGLWRDSNPTPPWQWRRSQKR